MSTEMIHDLDAFQSALEQHPRVLLFKHSPICPVSSHAKREWDAFLGSHPDVPTLFVDVVGDRPVARELAGLVGVVHQSPQAILFVDGQATWDRSHHEITVDSLTAAWQGAG